MFSSRASPTSSGFLDSGSGILSLGLGCFFKQLPVWVETVGGLSLAPAVMVSPATPRCSGTNGWGTCRRGASAVGGAKVLNFMGTGDGGASVVGVTEFSHVSLFRNQQKAFVCAHTCLCLGKNTQLCGEETP